MKKIIFYTLILFLLSCKKQDILIDCSIVPIITTNVNASLPCEGTGKITITAPIGIDFSYKIDNFSFQTSNEFTLLKPASYNITIKDKNGCTSTTTKIVDTISGGTKFKNVAATLATYCTPCHTGNNPQAGLNWLNPCDILQYWDRIKARAVDGNPLPMPPTGLIPLAERNKIMDWINAGHKFQD